MWIGLREQVSELSQPALLSELVTWMPKSMPVPCCLLSFDLDLLLGEEGESCVAGEGSSGEAALEAALDSGPLPASGRCFGKILTGFRAALSLDLSKLLPWVDAPDMDLHAPMMH